MPTEHERFKPESPHYRKPNKYCHAPPIACNHSYHYVCIGLYKRWGRLDKAHCEVVFLGIPSAGKRPVQFTAPFGAIRFRQPSTGLPGTTTSGFALHDLLRKDFPDDQVLCFCGRTCWPPVAALNALTDASWTSLSNELTCYPPF